MATTETFWKCAECRVMQPMDTPANRFRQTKVNLGSTLFGVPLPVAWTDAADVLMDVCDACAPIVAARVKSNAEAVELRRLMRRFLDRTDVIQAPFAKGWPIACPSCGAGGRPGELQHEADCVYVQLVRASRGDQIEAPTTEETANVPEARPNCRCLLQNVDPETMEEGTVVARVLGRLPTKSKGNPIDIMIAGRIEDLKWFDDRGWQSVLLRVSPLPMKRNLKEQEEPNQQATPYSDPPCASCGGPVKRIGTQYCTCCANCTHTAWSRID